MVAIEIPDELASQIERGAQRAGQSNDAFLRQAVLSYMEDIEDLALAKSADERLKDIGERTSLVDIGRQFGLAD